MSNTQNRTLRIEKTFDAPIELVWEAWTQADHIAKWWGPSGMELEVIAHDFTVGGTWKYRMPMPNGQDFFSEGTYLEIVEHEKIATTADFKPMTEGVELYISFEKAGDQTKFLFQVIHPTEEYCKQQEEMGFYNGWGSAFTRLEAHLLAHK